MLYSIKSAKSEKDVLQTCRHLKLPDYMHSAVAKYVVYGKMPGDFLRKLFECNFSEAEKAAKITNSAHMDSWIRLVQEYMPEECVGSEEIVEQWVASGGIKSIN